MKEPIAIELSRDEALVLFEFFARFAEEDLFRLRNNAEFAAFSALASQLDRAVVEPFQSNYGQLLEDARSRLAGRFEGLAPGVESNAQRTVLGPIYRQPVLAIIDTGFKSDKTVRVDEVRLAADGLSIRVESGDWCARVHFEQSYGFRVLDELDLTEFWSECTLQKGWLCEVVGGGWKDLELSRPHFISGQYAGTREYLIVGYDECVSVLSKESPVISAASP